MDIVKKAAIRAALERIAQTSSEPMTKVAFLSYLIRALPWLSRIGRFLAGAAKYEKFAIPLYAAGGALAAFGPMQGTYDYFGGGQYVPRSGGVLPSFDWLFSRAAAPSAGGQSVANAPSGPLSYMMT